MELFENFQSEELNGQQIRATPEVPRRVSVIDTIAVITGNKCAKKTWSELQKNFPEVVQNLHHFKFPGKGQRETPVVGAKGLVTIMNLLQGERAAKFRAAEADVLVGYLGGLRTFDASAASSKSPPTASAASMDIFKKFQSKELTGQQIRATNEVPRRVSVYDIIEVMTGNPNPRQLTANLCERFPEVVQLTDKFKFPGKGQRETPVVGAKGLVTIMNLLQGERAARFRAAEADVLVRYLGSERTFDASAAGSKSVPTASAASMEVFRNFQSKELDGQHIRATNEVPRRVSVYDAISVMTGHDSYHQTWLNNYGRFPEVLSEIGFFKFLGRGQRETPVVGAKGLVTIMNLLQGERAAKFRAAEADVLVRYLGGT